MDISYTVSGDIIATAQNQGRIPSLKVTATDQETGTSYTATSLSGDTGLADGTHSLVWNMASDGLTPQSTNLAFSVSCKTTQATYCVIDLSAGAEAASYPVTYLAEPPQGGFNVDEYKTTKLVLRRIEAGSFIMGEDQSNTNHRVTLTKPFFIGVFEVTQKQYQLVTGSNPSSFSGDKLPVEHVNYNAIRGSSNGAMWPSSNAVDSSSFMGKLRARTGIEFDLPTEAQWEYSCRAGTTTTYSYGDNASDDYMWYDSNSSSQTHEVGTKQSNPWGLYDMHGNIYEWCLDWYGPVSYGSDPEGYSSGSNRVRRGGCFAGIASSCYSWALSDVSPSDWSPHNGFRLARSIHESIPVTYCVIDLSAGAEAASYPVTYLAEPPQGGFNMDEYKTTKLVLRRIEAGSFIMGEDQSDESHRVTLTKPFFLGLFEVTQKQYQLVMGSNPSSFPGDKRPVESVSYNVIRGSSNGAQWPSSNAVDSSSFIGKLRERTGLDIDLPTEAQWEYACRAGTTTAYSYGENANGNYMWNADNSSSQTHEVGTKQPNPWGLYDMHGNVWEWCLDWFASSLAGGIDPKGSSSGSDRVFRGGSWYYYSSSDCTSFFRGHVYPSYGDGSYGFRLASAFNESLSATYCVIDLSAGTEASSYPVTYLATPPSDGFNVDEYKTTKLVLRRIEPGTFIMGEDQSDENHRVTLTKPFYIGLFEMTQKQYQLVTGSNPSSFSGDKLPVEQVSYDAIRGSSNGAQWPSSNAVDPSSFMGKLRARTGLDFDLPTEAQWEYACRAGTTTTYSYGNNANGNYMWYSSNSSEKTHAVGTKQPNPWGLYDMHGNVWEWCLDWYASNLTGGADPNGSSSGDGRVFRGGSWYYNASWSPSFFRNYTEPFRQYNSLGFRLARTINESVSTLCSGDSEPVSFDLTPATPIIFPEGGVVGSWPVSVSISCATEGATIHYTTDGTEPTADSPRYSRFRVSQRTTVKAIAIKDGLVSEVAVAEYALGQCDNPVITPNDGTTFEHSGQIVSIAWSGEDGILRYTTDGNDPTAESPLYGGPVTIDESTVVKAKAFGNLFLDSAVVTANLTRVWVNVATPTITAASSFTGSKTKVSLSCATDGATIRYTLNGNEPNSHSTRYTGPFYVTNSCIVKAYAVCPDYLDSAVATFAVEKVWGIGDTLGAPDHAFTAGGDVPFFRVTDATAPLGEAMHSGAITHNQTSTMTTTITGPGTISFQWKTSCEKDPDGWYMWDHAEFEVDGVVVAKLDGVTTWQTVSHDIAGDGSHTLVWRYVKDNIESAGDDCCRVADYRWASAYTATQTTEVPVPYVWLRGSFPEIADEYDAYEAAALATAANGVNKVWECYVAGVDPTDATKRFLATIAIDADGNPLISWNPDLNENGTKQVRVYTVEGKAELSDSWGPTNNSSRFFHVKVAMPE